MPQLNPVLCRDALSGELFPSPLLHEIFALRRSEIWFEGEIPGFRKMKASGRFYLTSHRIIFLVESQTNKSDLSSIAVGFNELRSPPDFKQPIFGANYLQLICLDASTISFSFTSGGCDALLPVLYRLFDAADKSNPSLIVTQVLQQRSRNVAFVDPNDPSVFYVTQPTPAPAE